MLSSKEQTFSDAQALTTTAASTNVVDLSATGTPVGAPAALVRDIGKGRRIDIVVQLDSAAGGTSPTLSVALQVDTVENFASPTTVFTAATLSGGAAGTRIPIYWVPEGTNQRYMRLYYTLGGTSPTYTVSAMIVAADQTND